MPTENVPARPAVASRNAPLSVPTVRDWLTKMKAELAAALPSQIPIERFIRVVNTSVRKNPKLLECEPMSFYGAVLTSAQIGLVPDGVLGEAYLIPRFNGRTKRLEACFQAGYQGLLSLCRRSGQIARITANIVYENEITQGKFTYHEGDEPRLEHQPIIFGDKGAPVAAYATATLKSGEKQIAVMSRDEIEEIRESFSKAGDSGPWKEWVTAKWMWKKTTLIQLQKLLPRDTEDQNSQKLAKVVALEERAMVGAPLDLAIEADPNGTMLGDMPNDAITDEDTPVEATVVAHSHPSGNAAIENKPTETIPEPPQEPEYSKTISRVFEKKPERRPA